MYHLNLNNMKLKFLFVCLFCFIQVNGMAQDHPRIYFRNQEKQNFLQRLDTSEKVKDFINELENRLAPYVKRHGTDPDWIVSRLQMYWDNKYEEVYVKGMDFSHGEGKAPVPTVRFSGSRDWATDYLVPDIEDVKPYMDDERGLYLQNGEKEGKPWEWVHPSETGHIIERINEKILALAQDAAFLYWLEGEEKYAVFASDIFMPYIKGMYHRKPPETIGDHHNANLMGLQTFEVIHERIVEPVAVCYDFLYSYLSKTGKNLDMIQNVFKKWADQEIKYGVPDNNWNMMQGRYITYLAIALEDDEFYEDGKGRQYYIDQIMNQNTKRQKALKDVMKNYDPETAIWPEVAGYSMGVSDDILEIFCLIDKSLDNNLVKKYPTIEKAILANFNYLFPNGFTTAYGDAKHGRLRFNSLELLISQYRKYNQRDKESMITKQLKRFIKDGAYDRNNINSFFELVFYVDELMDVPPADSFSEMVSPTFYSPNVSWIVQRNGHTRKNGMMISKNASLGNHSHANGINLELYARGMVIAPDCAAGESYWSEDHNEYYSRFPAHNTVVVDGKSDYQTMDSNYPFTLNSIYPSTDNDTLMGNYTFSDVGFTEPSTDALQRRLSGTIRTGDSTGYFVDIFRSARKDGNDKRHEYLFHSQGNLELREEEGTSIKTSKTAELSSGKGDLVGYDYFKDKRDAHYEENFKARFTMPSVLDEMLNINLWMKGYKGRKIFTVKAPYSRAIHQESVPEQLYQEPLPTLVVRQKGEARSRPFVAIIEAFNEDEGASVKKVDYFSPENDNPLFVGVSVHSVSNRADHIFNDEHSETLNTFDDGKFLGTYGIVSYKDEKLQSLFLGNGRMLEKGNWKVQTLTRKGAVLIMVNEKGLKINANQSFTLRMPVPESIEGKMILKTVDQAEEQKFSGEILEKDGEKIAEFQLPELKNAQFKF